jgi:catechol 2,3-dioxygenase-like lactoylglutathione lyase family enzyme
VKIGPTNILVDDQDKALDFHTRILGFVKKRRSRWGHSAAAIGHIVKLFMPANLAGYRLGRDRGSPNDGSTVFSKRVMAQIRSPVRVRT